MKKIFAVSIGIFLGAAISVGAATNVTLTKDRTLQYLNYVADSLAIGQTATTSNARLSVSGSSTVSGSGFFGGVLNFASFKATSTATSTSAGGISMSQIETTGNATNTMSNGINLTNGCIARNGTCIGGTGGGSGTNWFSGTGTPLMLAQFDSANSIRSATTARAASFEATSTSATSTFAGDVAIGTTILKTSGSGTSTIDLLTGTLADFNRFSWAATSTGSSGINLTGGCFAINGTCITAGGGGYTDAQARAAVIGLFPATTTSNTWLLSQTFNNIFATNASATNATTTNLETTNLKIDTLSGVLKASNGSVTGGATTSDVPEGSNLYYTTTRGAQLLAGTTTDAIAEGSNNLYYTAARFNTAFDQRLAATSTTGLAEGTNLYYTAQRVRDLLQSTYGNLTVSTTSANTWTGTQIFGSISMTNGTSTNFEVTGEASTTNMIISRTLFGAGLTPCNGASNALTWNAGVFGCNTITGGGGGGGSGGAWATSSDNHTTYLTPNWYAVVGGTATTSDARLTVVGSTTVTNALIVNGESRASYFTATSTTATSAFAGDLKVGDTIFRSAGNPTSTIALLDGTLAVFNRFSWTGGTSTGAYGINLTGGCFAINGVCLSTGGSATTTLFADGNHWTGVQNFDGGFIALASSTAQNFNSASSTLGTTLMGNATGTALYVSGEVRSGGATPGFVVSGSGAITRLGGTNVNMTASALQMSVSGSNLLFQNNAGGTANSGISYQTGSAAIESNTHRFVTGTNQETMVINGLGRVGIGTTSPLAFLSVAGKFGATTSPLFVVATSSTGLSTTTVFSVDYLGGTTMLNASSSALNVSGQLTASNAATSTFTAGINTAYINQTGTVATNTFANGISLSGGCFAVNGVCISTGGGGAVSSVSNSDGTLTISPTTGAVVASLAASWFNTFNNKVSSSSLRSGTLISYDSTSGFISGSTSPSFSHLNATSTDNPSFLRYASTTAVTTTATSTTGDILVTNLNGLISASRLFASGAGTSTQLQGFNATQFALSGGTSTAASGFNIQGGCYAINGTCIGGGGSGEVNTGASIGTGLNIYDSKSGAQLRFNTISAGSGITISTSTNSNTLVIAATASGGAGYVVNATGTDLQIPYFGIGTPNGLLGTNTIKLSSDEQVMIKSSALTARLNIGCDSIYACLKMSASSISDIAFSGFVSGDAYTRYSFLGDGSLELGGGTSVADTVLKRVSTSILALTGKNNTDATLLIGTTTAHGGYDLYAAGAINGTLPTIQCNYLDETQTTRTADLLNSVTPCGGRLYFDMNTDGQTVAVTNEASWVNASGSLRVQRMIAGNTAPNNINEFAFYKSALLSAATTTSGKMMGLMAEHVAQMPVGTATTSITYAFGFSDVAITSISTTAAYATPKEGCMIVASSTANWRAVCRRNNVEAQNVDIIATSTSQIKFRYTLNQNGFNVYVNDSPTPNATIAASSIPTSFLRFFIGLGLTNGTNPGITYAQYGSLKVWSSN